MPEYRFKRTIFHFDFRSGYDRKNPEAVLAAFIEAFGKDEHAYLIIKAGGGTWDVRNYLRFCRKLRESGLGCRAVVLWDFMPHQDILDLIAASDVYMSLHRGEGLGIGMLEAMCVGTPVIATNYGGNTDFTNPETAFLVDYRMVRPATGYDLFKYVKEWPEPDVRQAANYLRLLKQDPSLAEQKARKATEFIRDFFSVEKFADDVKQVLRDTAKLRR